MSSVKLSKRAENCLLHMTNIIKKPHRRRIPITDTISSPEEARSIILADLYKQEQCGKKTIKEILEYSGLSIQPILNILLGCLGDPETDMRIGFTDRCWTLAAGSGDSYEVLCRHEDFHQFVELVHEYSDYVEGE